MWILPKQLITSYPSAQVCGDSNEELQELASQYERCAMWKSKPSLASTWLSRWKRVWWMKHLFGRTLKLSMEKCFETEYTASLEVIPVSLSVLRVEEREQKMPDTCGHISKNTYVQLDLFGASLKTCQDTSLSDTKKSEPTYKDLVIRLRKEYLVRKKLAHHTEEKDCLSWQSEKVLTRSTPRVGGQEGYKTRLARGKDTGLQGQVEYYNQWATPTVHQEYGRYNQGGQCLQHQVRNWPTPTVSDNHSANLNSTQQKEGSMHSVTLPQAVKKNWPTPSTIDTKGANGIEHMKLEKPHMGQLPNAVRYGLHDQENNNTNGKHPVKLNPAWELMLMGTRRDIVTFL